MYKVRKFESSKVRKLVVFLSGKQVGHRVFILFG